MRHISKVGLRFSVTAKAVPWYVFTPIKVFSQALRPFLPNPILQPVLDSDSPRVIASKKKQAMAGAIACI